MSERKSLRQQSSGGSSTPPPPSVEQDFHVEARRSLCVILVLGPVVCSPCAASPTRVTYRRIRWQRAAASARRRRVERGIYQQPNGKYAVCVRVDGRARFRTLEATTLVEARRHRELLQSIARVGELPLSPRLTFAEVATRWL